MTTYIIQPGLILKGDAIGFKKVLEELPADAKLIFEFETYCAIQRRSAVKAFKLLLDDPRFVFDDLFIARQLYFSALPSRELVMRHPKFLKLIRAKRNFMEYFYERYGPNANMTHVGMLQRYLQVENALRYREKQTRMRLAFFLYPALIQYSRSFLERYYAHGAPGYLKGKESFEREAQVKV